MSGTKTPPGYIGVSSPASTCSWSAADVTHTPDPDQGAALRADLAAAIKRAEEAEALAAALQAEAEAGVALVVARAEAAERDAEAWRGFAGSAAIVMYGASTGGVIANHLAVEDLPDLLGAVERLRARAEAAEAVLTSARTGGAAAERAAVVAWLRAGGPEALCCAGCIERGEHFRAVEGA